MLKQEGGSSAGAIGGGSAWGRVCDSCRASASVVYCRADIAYLCAGCDARIHAANRVASRHERVWVCEACDNAPAAFTCKADAASLCTTCDADIHSANPLARRHQRVPILPISGCLYGPPATMLGRTIAGLVIAAGDTFSGQDEIEEIEEDDDDDHEEEEGDVETESWLLLNNPLQVKTNNNNNNNQGSGNGYSFGGGDVDEYLDVVDYNNSCTSTDRHQHSVHHQQQFNNNQQQNQLELEINNNDASDSVVPVHHHQQHHQQNFQLEMEYEASKVGFSYTGTIDISNSVSLSSMDASIVPDSTMNNDISNSHSRPPKGTIDLFSSHPIQIPPHQCSPLDREARVLRYREKRKTRKFEKTIRYASRKAYAETRPRIKGRFAKRSDVEVEVDQIMFSTSLMADTDYGIVPSF